jgi:transcriptional regulator with XRE-family HTH domain
MSQRFGDALRRARRKGGKTLSDLAGLLGVSIVYVSDVERGNRKPLSSDRILKAARFLQIDPAPLLIAAAKERGVIEYEISKARPLEAEVVGGLVSGLARGGVTDDQLRGIQQILNSDTEDDDE